MNSFSASSRANLIRQVRSQPVDVIVIGGGITGCGIALDAIARGLSVTLVEKSDFAFGTSSRSTKLIHGGLRYLKQLEFGLVKEVGSERAVVHRLAPHLVLPEKMLLPLYEKRGLGYWLTSLGLKIYDLLAGVLKEDQRKMLARQQTLRAEPLLKKDEVRGGAIYAEYRTDDARLTIEIAKAAAKRGAVLLNYVEVVDFTYQGDLLNGVDVRDALSGERFTIGATSVVNAAGPWVDDLRDKNKSRTGKRLHLTKGVHIVVPHTRLPVKQAIYFDVPDGRMIFAIPRGRVTYIGTTDTNYNLDKDHVVATKDDAQYLVNGVNSTFEGVSLSIDDIESTWAGLRPLIHEDGKSASELSRKDEIFESPTGLISIAGGKLTGYRKMAERVVNLVVRKYFPSRNLSQSSTINLKLTDKPFQSFREVVDFTRKLEARLKPYPLTGYTARYLVENYGTAAEQIMQDFSTMVLNDEAELALLKSEVKYTVNHEMVTALSDFFVRRTGLLYFEIRKVIRYQQPIADYMGSLLNWSRDQVRAELASIDKWVADVTEFKAK
jgi:glycerol-3-phosphate dehydrogenase